MKTKILLTLCLVCLAGIAYAQNSLLTGMVQDSTTGAPVSFATVALLKSGETAAFTGAISDEAGVFSIEKVPNGTYDLLVSFIGYKSLTIPGIRVASKEQVMDLGKITIRPENLSLETVEVVGVQRTEERRIDRITYRTADFETARGGNALDVLSKLPSVSVDPDGEVAVRGASDFMVYLNGKPTLMKASDMLSQIPANQIVSVDIITVPSSRYDAQGKGGIINITTSRSALQGLSVALNGMVGGTPWTNDTDRLSGHALNNNRINTGASLTYNTRRLSVTGSLNLRNTSNKGIGDIGAFMIQDPVLGSTSAYPDHYYYLEGIGSRPKWDDNITASAGFSFEPGKRSLISATYQFAHRESGRAAYYLYDIWFAEQIAGERTYRQPQVYNPNADNRTGTFSNLSFDYTYRLNKESRLFSSLMLEQSGLDQTITNKEYAYHPDFDQQAYASSEPSFHSYQEDATPLKALRYDLNFTGKTSRGQAFEIGLQPQWVRLDGMYSYDTLQPDGTMGGFNHFNNSIELNRDIYAAYADFSGSVNKLSYKLGLRMEYLNQEMQVNSTAYFREVYDFFGSGRDYDETDFIQRKLDLFPSVHLSYAVNEKNVVTLAGSRRINRPPAKDMSPFLYRRHQEIFELGDPLLSPEYILVGELSYQNIFGNNSLTLTGFYRDTENAIYRVNRLTYQYNANPGGVLLRSITNAGNQMAIGGEMGLNLVLVKKIKAYLGGSLYHISVEADERLFGEQLSSSGTNWSLSTNVNWSMTQALKLTFDYMVTSPSVTPQGENYRFSMSNVALSLAPQRWSNWSFSARLLDVFGTNQSGGYTTAFSSGVRMFNRGYIYDYEGRIVEISAIFSLNAKARKTAKKALIGGEYF